MKSFQQQVPRGSSTLVDRVLVGAGSCPCTMQFRFENHYSTLLEKVALSYRIQVTPPSAATVQQGRRRRGQAALKIVEQDLVETQQHWQRKLAENEQLVNEMADLRRQYETTLASWQVVKRQEQEYRKRAGLPDRIQYNRNDFLYG
jgi:hypothetical protein